MIYISRKRRQITVSNKKRYSKKRAWTPKWWSRLKKNKKLQVFRYALAISGVAVLVAFLSVLLVYVRTKDSSPVMKGIEKETILPDISIQAELLTPNKYSRPQLELKEVKGIVVHYTANPGSDAISNRNYFNNLPQLNKKRKKKTYASSHFIVGLKGEIIQCVPLNEMAYASNDRNVDTISIECCHPNKSGKFNKITYEALKELVVYLCIRFHLNAENIIRHYDVTGKLCPKYYVEHEDKWIEFKSEIENALKQAEKYSSN